MGVDPPDVFHAGTGYRHDGVMHRKQRFMGQRELPVSEGLVQQVVRRGDRPDERIFYGKAAGIGAPVAHGRDGVGDLAAGYRLEVGPPAPRRRLTEGAVGSLNRYAHLGHAPVGICQVTENENAPSAIAGGASRVRSGRATARYRNRTQLEPRRRW